MWQDLLGNSGPARRDIMNETPYRTFRYRSSFRSLRLPASSSRIGKHPEIGLTMAGTGKSTGGEPGNPLPCTHWISHTYSHKVKKSSWFTSPPALTTFDTKNPFYPVLASRNFLERVIVAAVQSFV